MSKYDELVREGYSDEDIRQWVKSQPSGAQVLAEGYSPQEFIEHLEARPQAPGQQQLSAAPGQYEGVLRFPAIAGSEALRGLEAVVGIPGNLMHLESSLLDRVGVPHLPPFLPTGEQLATVTGRLGITQNPSLTPGWGTHPDAERMVAGFNRGAASTLPLSLLGPEGGAVPSLLAGGLGGAIEQEATQQQRSGMLDAAAGAGAGLMLGSAVAKSGQALNAAAGRLTPLARDFHLGDLPLRSPNISGPSRFGAEFAPLEATHGDIARTLSTVANRLGNSTTLQEAGSYAQKQARDWLTTTMPAKEALAWAPVDKAIPSAAPTPVGNLEGVLKRIVSQGGDLQTAVAKLRPTLPDQVYKALQIRLSALTGGSPTWADARALRSAIGEAMSDPSIAPKAGAKNLSTMYAAITQDLNRTAQAHGAGQLFRAANAESTRLHQFAENTIGKVIAGKAGGDDPLPEKVAADLLAPSRLKKGGSDFQALNSELPDVTRELAAVHLHELATPKGSDPPIGFKFSKAWSQMSPEAKAALLPRSARAQLDALSRVSIRLKALSAPSSPATSHSILGLGSGAAASLAGAGLYHLLPESSPLGLETLAEIAGGTGTLGAGWGLVRNKMAAGWSNSPLAARLNAGQPVTFPGQIALSAALGAESNDLAPYGRP